MDKKQDQVTEKGVVSLEDETLDTASGGIYVPFKPAVGIPDIASPIVQKVQPPQVKL